MLKMNCWSSNLPCYALWTFFNLHFLDRCNIIFCILFPFLSCAAWCNYVWYALSRTLYSALFILSFSLSDVRSAFLRVNPHLALRESPAISSEPAARHNYSAQDHRKFQWIVDVARFITQINLPPSSLSTFQLPQENSQRNQGPFPSSPLKTRTTWFRKSFSAVIRLLISPPIARCSPDPPTYLILDI